MSSGFLFTQICYIARMKIETKWDLKLLYKGDTDPQIEADLKFIEKSCENFGKKYKGKDFTKSPETLAKALKDYEKLSDEIGSSKPWWYFALRTCLNSGDSKAEAMATKNDQRITEASNKIKFFILEIGKIPTKKRDSFLKDNSLKFCSYFLKRILDKSKYNLTEGEEQLADLLTQTSYSMWKDSQERLLSQQTIRVKNKDLPIAQVIGELGDMKKKDRHDAYKKINTTLRSISHGAEAEMNAVYNYKNIMDRRRGFEKPYSETILRYENDEKAIESFVELVTKHMSISHRFYKLHAKILGEKKLSVADRAVKIGEIKTKFDFETSVSMFRSVLSNLDTEYVEIFDRFLKNGHIDVYPKKGKRGGAFCWGMSNSPTYVLLNHVDNIKSLETLAHEMGHAIHTELSHKQTPFYQGYTTSTAEVASTFFEQLMMEESEKYLSDKEKITFLHNKISGDITTIFRQIACFNFENELHQKIRKDGQANKNEIAEIMRRNIKSYMGNAVDVTEDDGYYFVYWSHIRNFFYVYSYAYGQIISRALYEKYKQDPTYAKKIKQFLSAGRSMSPEEIFKSIGIDTSKTSFFESGLKGIERDIIRLEKLIG